ncbi:MAG: SOS response-associated peptidase [archaeon]
MCGRFSLSAVQDILTRWNAQSDEPLRPRYNVSPGQMVPIIPNDEPNKLVMAKWGLIPHWSKDASIGYKTINAKVETITQKPTYKIPFQKHRCLVPADGFYEWKKTPGGKVPFRFLMKDSGLFAFAGIFEMWKDEKGNIIKSFSIITVEPNDLVKEVHSRMPAILRREHEKLWLADTPTVKLLEIVLKPYPAASMKCYEVSRIVNSSMVNTPEMILPIKPLQKKSLLDF